ncbi:XRE family transcriptional regulator of biofilm formation [Cytobacillus firmus]|uniref:XRE family transcriptional regulator of biofilm formation n=2 Tax=Cytobacillus TaxID=2675230 RepID=A0A366JVG4_CYTFI|nr:MULTISPECIES: helix-turn-helix domain-containing protein [Cytobacillus]RBP93162.1 XRE family transcriptional regulator of biofilm formation [Cytobacillus firmus]TDX42764.1 XRE family transcriptional regulator of biofilm formation [Cytobacillus oceanisediminis]
MIGGRIKTLRIKKGYSINELSDKAEVSKSYLSYIERGIQENPSLQVLSRIARTLDANLEDLLEENKDEITDLSKLDEEWVSLVKEAIRQGITKEDFAYYLEFIKFKKMKGGKA